MGIFSFIKSIFSSKKEKNVDLSGKKSGLIEAEKKADKKIEKVKVEKAEPKEAKPKEVKPKKAKDKKKKLESYKRKELDEMYPNIKAKNKAEKIKLIKKEEKNKK